MPARKKSCFLSRKYRQPRIPGTDLSYSRLVAGIMALAGVVMLLVRYEIIRLKFAENWEEEYQIAEKSKPAEAK